MSQRLHDRSVACMLFSIVYLSLPLYRVLRSDRELPVGAKECSAVVLNTQDLLILHNGLTLLHFIKYSNYKLGLECHCLGQQTTKRSGYKWTAGQVRCTARPVFGEYINRLAHNLGSWGGSLTMYTYIPHPSFGASQLIIMHPKPIIPSYSLTEGFSL